MTAALINPGEAEAPIGKRWRQTSSIGILQLKHSCVSYRHKINYLVGVKPVRNFVFRLIRVIIIIRCVYKIINGRIQHIGYGWRSA